MKYYVLRPDLTPYEGVSVNKDTEIDYQNDKVKQKVKNLKLETLEVIKNEQFERETKTIINLKEGDILLFENENRGYFLPYGVGVGTIETCINDYKALADVLDGDNNGEDNSKGNEETNS